MRTAEITKSGLKVFENGQHIKTIPAKYEAFIHDADFFEGGKRLTDKQRFILEYAYFLSILKKEEKYVYELIEKSTPDYSQIVKNHIGEERFELVFTNKVRLKINKELFELCPKKESPINKNY
jgi:hypothetical protein